MLDSDTHEYLDELVSYVSVFDDPANLDQYVLTLNATELMMFTETMFILATQTTNKQDYKLLAMLTYPQDYSVLDPQQEKDA